MKKYISLAVVAVSVWGLSSCLKDKNLVLDPAKSPAVVEFSTIKDQPGDTAATYTLYSRAYDVTPQGIDDSFGIIYSGGAGAPSDVTVNVAVDAAVLAAYSEANPDAGLETMPTNLYTLAGSVVIKKGERKADLLVHFNMPLFDKSKTYALALRITSTTKGSIGANHSTVVYSINAKNIYDGVYSLKGFMHRDLDMSLGGTIKDGVTVSLVTTGSNTVRFDQTWADGGGLAGLNPVVLAVDATSNAVTPTSVVSHITSLPDYKNRYDPATKTFYISIIWGGTDPNHRSAVDTLKYIQSR